MVLNLLFSSFIDNRTTKRKTIGRSKKYTGDLCMLAGLPQEALSQYLIAGEHLRAANDLLWLAGTLEGQCAASLAFITNEAEEGIKSLILPTECAANSVNVTSNGLGSEVDESKFRNPLPLNEEDMVERLQEALKHYSRVSGVFCLDFSACSLTFSPQCSPHWLVKSAGIRRVQN